MAGRSVLICDDAKFMRAVIRQVLTQHGYTVVGEAETGRQAVERYAELGPDVVTMDVVMPELDGISAIRHIVERAPAARIVVCSAVGQDRQVGDARAAGARAFVVKPFQPPQLLDAVAEALSAAPSPVRVP